MKNYVMRTIGCMLLAVISACGNENSARFNIAVRDETGNPVQDAEVRVRYFRHWEAGEGFGKDVFGFIGAKTNQSGAATVDASSTRGEFDITVAKSGFYETSGNALRTTVANGGKWQPWDQKLNVELRRVINPIPLIARWTRDRNGGLALQLPALDKDIGFDLEKSDWVAPHGQGSTPDLVLRLAGATSNLNEPHRATFTLRFSNPGDGIVTAPSDTLQSKLRVPHGAPLEGYVPQLVTQRGLEGGKRFGGPNKNTNYFLRLRTKMDKNGAIISANYAKVYEDFEWFASGAVRFRYYFNPTPNDRNLEFDPARNLYKDPLGYDVSDP